MNVEELKSVIAERIRIGDETQDEWYDGINAQWEKEIEFLSRDMAATVKFIENDFDDETFYWIGEVFDDVAERTQSKDFLVAITKRAEKVVDTEKRRSVETDVRYASYKFDDD